MIYLALFLSALSQPFWLALPKKGLSNLTVNFWAVVAIGIVFLPFLFTNHFHSLALAHPALVAGLVVSQAGYAASTLMLTNNHHFQIAYPLTRIGPITILIAEVIFLRQAFTMLQVIGILLVCCGAVWFSADARLLGLRVRFLGGLIIVLSFLTSAMILSKVALGLGFTPNELWALVWFQLPINFGFVWWNKKTRFIKDELKNWKIIVSSAFFMVFTWYMAMLVLTELPAAIVSAGRSASIIFGVYLGGKMFNEGHHAKHYLAAILIIAGITLSLFEEIIHNGTTL